MYPRHSHVIYLDSGSAKQKNYADIKSVLDKALTGFAAKAGPLKEERRSRGCLTCIHTTKFACLKQSEADNGMDAWFAILQMREFVKDQHVLLLPSSLQKRGIDMANAPDAQVRAEFRHIQRLIATIIHQDVCTMGGLFFYNHIRPTNAEIESRLEACHDERPFNTLEGILPFPPKPKP
jgi:hypothetical protein